MQNSLGELYIKDLADIVRKKIEGGKIYGVNIDMNNINHLIAASYLAGEMEYTTARIVERLNYGIAKIDN